MRDPLSGEGHRSTRRRTLITVGVLGIVGVLLWYLIAMPGMDMSGRDSAGPTSSSDSPGHQPRVLDPAQFEQAIGAKGALVINVHTPYAGEISGTDLAIPFGTIAGDGRMPADRNAPILLYCRSGRMSGEAAQTLVAAGYTNVSELDGGMDAWAMSGRTLVGTGN